jgi:hypothetical protein
MKTCTICRTVIDLAAWRALSLVGYHDDDVLDSDHPTPTTLELRNCHCGATLSVELPRRLHYTTPTLTRLVASDPRVMAALQGLR